MKVAIIGGSGYGGGELLRFLIPREDVEIVAATSGTYAGEFVYTVHPNLRGFTDLKFTPLNLPEVTKQCDLVFLATPHGVSKDMVPGLLDAGLRVIDLSADFRLKDPADYPKWYGWEHPHPELLGKAVFGLPELHRGEIKGASLVACSGCMSGATTLALAPLVKAGLIDTTRLVVDTKIGSSGGGSDPTLASHHPEKFGSVRPYNVTGHRHIAEIEQELTRVGGAQVRIAFTPHSVDMARGILSTSHAWLTRPVADSDVWKAYRGFYVNEPFIRFVKSKKGLYQLPDPKVVVGTNFCDIGFMVDDHVPRLVVFSAIDNIVKGAAGQAVQCFNLMTGKPEDHMLRHIGFH